MVHGEDHILRIDGKAGENIFVLNDQPVPAPAGWDGTISSLYEAQRIANALQRQFRLPNKAEGVTEWPRQSYEQNAVKQNDAYIHFT